MKIRSVEWRDFDDLVQNYYSIYDELPEHPGVGITLFPEKPTLAAEARWFGNMYADLLEGSLINSVAEVDGHAVGSCTVRADGHHSETSHRGLIGILIRRGYRGQGLGRALMEDILGKCVGRFEIVHLSVFSDNQVAKRLYASLGFVPVGHHPNWIKRGALYFGEDFMQLDMAKYKGRPGSTTGERAPPSP